MTPVSGAKESSSRRVALLAGQALCLGLTAAWIAIPASAIFLEAYGSGLLPLTYIGAAVAGAAASAALAIALRRRPLASVAMSVLMVLSVVLVAAWILLWKFGADWVSFGMLVLVPITVPVGFMLIVAQAGMLLDVRALKTNYARVIAGFALGFVTGGVAGPPLLDALGRTEHLLAAGASVAGLFVLLVSMTRRTFSTELSAIDAGSVHAGRPTLRVLLRHRYVVLIMGFQMLSAVESQWLDYLVFDRAGRRYTDTRELAVFVSRFMAITYAADIIFLLVVAGAVMRRFGLRYGLTANPLAVLALIGAMITAATMQGSGATIVFVLVVSTRVSDLVLSDGTTRTSLSAAYQAVPSPVRLAAQATVEGLAVPVAIGMSGLGLIILRATVGTDGLMLPVLTSIVVVAWTVVALFVYRNYRVNLLANLRHRTLDPAELTIEGPSTLAAIDRLIDSADERDVRLGLDTLTVARHPDLATRLQPLARDERVGVRSDVLARLVRIDPALAAAAARHGLAHPSRDVREASVRTLAATGDPSDLSAITACLSDSDSDVKVAVVAAMTRIGDDSARRQVAVEIEALARSGTSDRLVLAARMLGGCDPGASIDRRALRNMLDADDDDVVNAALAAIRWPDDQELLVAVVGHLENRATARASVDALARSGDPALELVDDGFRGHLRLGRHGREQLARVCRMIGSPKAVAVLRRNTEHRDREVGLAAMTALAALHVSDINAEGVPAVRADLEHSSYVLQALQSLADAESAVVLRSALRDELELLRRRVVAGLSIRYGSEELSRVEFQLAQTSTRFHALALEWLDVTLIGADRAAVALLEPGLSPQERLRVLGRWFPIPPSTLQTILPGLVDDRDGRWRRPWLTACVLHAAAEASESDFEGLARTVSIDSPVDEVGDPMLIVRETMAGIRKRHASTRDQSVTAAGM